MLMLFMRALNWDDLHDAWPTAVGGDGVSRYTTATPPMYQSLEVGLSSPAVVHDVVFVSTSPPPYGGGAAKMYALSADDGHCLWTSSARFLRKRECRLRNGPGDLRQLRRRGRRNVGVDLQARAAVALSALADL